MNEKLQQIITEYLTSGKDLMDQAWLVGQEQVPLLIQEILVFKGVQHTIMGLLFLSLSALWFFFQIKFIEDEIKRGKMLDKDWTELRIFYGLFILQSALIIPGIFNVFDALKVFLAPRLYLIEYAADLVG